MNSFENTIANRLLPPQKKKNSLKHTFLRWIVLFLGCFILIGDSYSFDNPQAIQMNIEESLQITRTEFNLLYSVVSMPNTIMPFFGGFLLDLFGVRICMLVFSGLLIIGQIVFTYGGYLEVYWIMVLGRIIFGLGNESLHLCPAAIISKWFKHQEMALALGLNFSFPKLGSAANSLITPRLYDINKSLAFPFLVGAFICMVSWGSGVLLCYFDYKNDVKEGLKNPPILEKFKSIFKKEEKPLIDFPPPLQLSPSPSINPPLSENFDPNPNTLTNCTPRSQPNSGDLNPLQSSPAGALEINKGNEKEIESSSGEEPIEKITFSDLKSLTLNFWMLLLICSATEGIFVCFLDNANNYYQVMFNYNKIEAGNLITIPYFAAACFAPMIGMMVDIIGRRGKFMILTSILFIITFSLFIGLGHQEESFVIAVLPLLLLGICYSFYASVVMASIPLVVDEKIIGTALGTISVFQNTMMAVFPLIVGAICDQFIDENEDKGLRLGCIFLLGVSVLLALVSIYLNWLDKKSGGTLEKIHKQKQ